MKIPTLKLNKNTSIPVLGFGTYKLQGKICQQAVEKALEVGYRHIDTAEYYENHKEIAKAIAKSKIPRKDLFITSKVWWTNLRRADVLKAGKQTLKDLKTDYLDLYLIHWPNFRIPIRETLESLNELKKKSLIKAIGVSNFTINHLKDALQTGVEITNNQFELHPSFYQKDLVKFCHNHHIVVTAYSPLGRGEDLSLPAIKKLAKKYNRSASQVVLNWVISQKIVAIPKAAKKKHIKDNFKTLKWKLEKKDIKLINKLNRNNRLIQPAFAEFDYVE